jgi:tRNA G18 (ribose-2'-O)-methylase SpoU
MRKLSLKELNRASTEAFKEQEKIPFVLVLDNIRSALNVGSVFRTADGFSLEKVVLCGITAQPPHREILKTAIGATETVNWQYFEQTADALVSLKEQGYQIVGIEQTDESILLSNFKLERTQKYAFVFGNEVKGLEDTILPVLDQCIEIPQFGTKHSFNIAVCVGIVSWEMFRQFTEKQN